MLEKLHFAGNY